MIIITIVMIVVCGGYTNGGFTYRYIICWYILRVLVIIIIMLEMIVCMLIFVIAMAMLMMILL